MAVTFRRIHRHALSRDWMIFSGYLHGGRPPAQLMPVSRVVGILILVGS